MSIVVNNGCVKFKLDCNVFWTLELAATVQGVRVQNRWPDVKVSPEPPRTAANGSELSLSRLVGVVFSVSQCSHWPLASAVWEEKAGDGRDRRDGWGGGGGVGYERVSLSERSLSISQQGY